MDGETLLRTETNSSDDSQGVAFGLQGNLFLPVVAAGVVSIMLLTVLMVTGTVSIPASIAIAVVPFALTLAIVKIFLNDKPPHYMQDCWDSVLSDGSFARHSYHPEHPLDAAKAAAAKAAKKRRKHGKGS